MIEVGDGALRELNPVREGEEGANAENDQLPVDDSLNLPVLTVFNGLALRQLLIISVFVILLDVIQLVCQVCLTIQSRNLITSIMSAFTFCWTLVLLFTSAKWVIILSRNKIEIIRKGKMLALGCQCLSFLNLVTALVIFFIEEQRRDEYKGDNSIQWLIGTMIFCSCFNIIGFCIILSLIIRGQREIHRVIGSWLWTAIQRQMQRQQMLIEDNVGLREYLQSVYDNEQLHYSSAAA